MLEILISVAIALNIPMQHIGDEIISPNNVVITRVDSSKPYITSRAGLVMDMQTKTILYQQNIFTPLPIASLTKLMTAKIILDENNLEEIVKVNLKATQTGGSTMNLYANEEITVGNLLNGLLIQSGNDAAVALAIHNAGSVEEFVKKMNKKAKTMKLENTKFQNPMGFDNAENYSTAYDLSILAMNIYKHPTIKKIAKTESMDIVSTNNQYHHYVQSTNALLNNYLNVIGLKTGSTEAALGCFIGITNSENPHLSIVLGSNQRFLDSKILLDWAKNTFEYN
jgi:D-alanyl-D-alanine carboxypeptidase (penicillin-binding protein 5/6)